MQTQRDCFSGILFPDDLATMAKAHGAAMAEIARFGFDPVVVARIAVRLYQMGVVDETRLAENIADIALRGLPANLELRGGRTLVSREEDA